LRWSVQSGNSYFGGGRYPKLSSWYPLNPPNTALTDTPDSRGAVAAPAPPRHNRPAPTRLEIRYIVSIRIYRQEDSGGQPLRSSRAVVREYAWRYGIKQVIYSPTNPGHQTKLRPTPVLSTHPETMETRVPSRLVYIAVVCSLGARRRRYLPHIRIILIRIIHTYFTAKPYRTHQIPQKFTRTKTTQSHCSSITKETIFAIFLKEKKEREKKDQLACLD
jgi:hypothetical protein